MSTPGEQEPTRKERRDEARVARKAIEAQAAQGEMRRRRLMQLGGVGILAVAVIGIALAFSDTGGKNEPVKAHSKQSNENVAQVKSMLDGIPQSGSVLGSATAPAKLVYFGDLECPICKDFTVGALPSVIANFVRGGKLKVEYEAMQTATREAGIFREQQAAALAAGKQGLLWYFVELFYREQGEEGSGYVTPAFLRGIAAQVPGLNVAKWEAERTNPKLVEAIEASETRAGEEGFNGTPSFLLGKGSGPYRKLTSFSEGQLANAAALFEPEIEKTLKG